MALDPTQQMALRLHYEGREPMYIVTLCKQTHKWLERLLEIPEAQSYLKSFDADTDSDLPIGYDWDTEDFTRASQIEVILAYRELDRMLRSIHTKDELKLEIFKALVPRVQKAPRVLDKIAPDVAVTENKTIVMAENADAVRLHAQLKILEDAHRIP